MTDVINGAAPQDATELRNALVDQLMTMSMITMPRVEHAFRTVPREEFMPPGTPLDATYDVDRSVATKVDEHGVTISSISAVYIQARMIEQAGVSPAEFVVEIGSGGANAALLAEVVGPSGRIVSIDIDPDVIEQARARLAAAGYLDRVELVLADGEFDLPVEGSVDHVVVTVGAWDIPPAWWRHLASDGSLVLPLRMNGVTRSLGMQPVGDHLESTSAEVCGFVPMQGAGAHTERTFRLPDGHGHALVLRFDSNAPEDLTPLDGVLAYEPEFVWSGVSIAHGTSFADLHLWLAWFMPGFCLLAADKEHDLAVEMVKSWFPFGAVERDSLAILAVRPTGDGSGVEFGARAYGPTASEVGVALCAEVQAWDRQGRGDPAPTVAFWPTGTTPVTGPGRTATLPKLHGVLTISWPSPA